MTTTEYHSSNLGNYANAEDLTKTIDGYVQLPGSTFDADRYDFGSDDLEDANVLEYWRDEWFPSMLRANETATARINEALQG